MLSRSSIAFEITRTWPVLASDEIKGSCYEGLEKARDCLKDLKQLEIATTGTPKELVP